jgi:DDE superfamily endonuclease
MPAPIPDPNRSRIQADGCGPRSTACCDLLSPVRLCPGNDETEVTAAQLRDVVTRLIAAGHWHEGDPPILMVFDAGYDVTRLAWLLKDLPVEEAGRLRSDRAPPR